MSFLDQNQPASASIMNGQFQTLLRSLFNKPITGQEQQGQDATGNQPLNGGQQGGQQGQQGKQTTAYSALGTAASAAAPAVKNLVQSLMGGGGGQQSPQNAGPNDPNVAGGPDDADAGTDTSADVAGGPDVTPADSGSMSSSFFSGLFGG